MFANQKSTQLSPYRWSQYSAKERSNVLRLTYTHKINTNRNKKNNIATKQTIIYKIHKPYHYY